MSSVYHQPSEGEFRHDLFSCCESISDTLLAFLCPHCFSFCAAQDADEGMLCAVLNCLFYPNCLCFLRKGVRDKRGIKGSFLSDICLGLCCPCCTVIQIRREFTN